MTYLIREIQIFLVLAAAIGFATAWLMARSRALRPIRRLEEQVREADDLREGVQLELEETIRAQEDSSSETAALQEAVIQLEKERDALQRSLDYKEMEDSDLAARQESDSSALKELRAELESAISRTTELEGKLSERVAQIGRLEEEILRLRAEAKTLQSAADSAGQAAESAQRDADEAKARFAAHAQKATERAPTPPLKSYPIGEVPGVRPADAERLVAMGLSTNLDLVRKCGHASGLDVVAASTGMSARSLRSWTNAADLLRVDGIRVVDASNLLGIGIESIQALAGWDPKLLAAKLKTEDVDADRVQTWIAAARSLRPMIEA